MDKLQKNKISLAHKKVTIIGAGVIGASWAAVFLAKKMTVTISDPKEGIAREVKAYIKVALNDLTKLGLNEYNVSLEDDDVALFFEKDISKAVHNADYIQENGPENKDFKIKLWQEVEMHAPAHTCFLSSSSGITATEQGAKLKQPERLVVGHPFNPPHLMPLVEVVPGEAYDDEKIDYIMDFYNALDKKPKLIKKETSGFVANRLQAAIFRECVSLIQKGVVTVDELDDIVTSSLGIRWASGGPFLAFHLGGGAGGITHFLDHLAPNMALLWAEQLKTPVSFDEETKKIITEQINAKYGKKTISSLEKDMNRKETTVITALD